ncbi:MAG: acetyl-CoA carboxylase carboxyltransferase subunit alpha [Erysipelotrichaceae bacterium]
MKYRDYEQQMMQITQEIARLDQQDGEYESKFHHLQQQLYGVQKEAKANLTPADQVYLARHPLRPKADDYIAALFPDFMELHGDRLFGDDAAIVGGIALFHGTPVTVLAQRKGKNLEENLGCNFGMVHPEGYRKVIRLAQQAEKYNRPIIMFVDTPGAYPGIGAEQRGQSEAIAKCLQLFSGLKVPLISVVIGEGGSGGALAMSIADRLIMLEHSVYSILSPEGFASILWKDATRADEAAALMKLRALDLHEAGIADVIVTEPLVGIHQAFEHVIHQLDNVLQSELEILKKTKTPVLLQQRYLKFRRIGAVHESC